MKYLSKNENFLQDKSQRTFFLLRRTLVTILKMNKSGKKIMN